MLKSRKLRIELFGIFTLCFASTCGTFFGGLAAISLTLGLVVIFLLLEIVISLKAINSSAKEPPKERETVVERVTD